MKSEIEKRFDSLCEQYEDEFGKSYVIQWGNHKTLEEHVSIIEKALKTKTPIDVPELKKKVIH